MVVCVPESMVGMGVCRATVHPVPVVSYKRRNYGAFSAPKCRSCRQSRSSVTHVRAKLTDLEVLVTGGRRISILSDSVPETARM